MSNTKTFFLDLGEESFASDQSSGVFDRDSQIVRGAVANFADDLLEAPSAILTVFKFSDRVRAILTTGEIGEIAVPVSMVGDTGCNCETCRCGDPAPSDAGTEIITGGPEPDGPWWVSPSAGGVVSPDVLASRAGEVADAMDEARSAIDVALDGEPNAVEAPKLAALQDTAEEPNTALDASPVAQEVRKVPLGMTA